MDSPVQKIPLPAESRARTTLPRLDYTDSFLIETGQAGERTAEQWAQLILDRAPSFWQRVLPRGWRMLGLAHVAVGTPDSVLGWPIVMNAPDCVLLSAVGRRGLSAELLVERRDDGVLFATLQDHHNRIAAIGWALITPLHQLIVMHLLKTAVRKAGSEVLTR
jgi:hypothetical protein